MTCVVHTGPFATISEAYDAIAKGIDQNDPNPVNEIQFPVEKMEQHQGETRNPMKQIFSLAYR